jgi:hypothetical protein
MWKSGAFDEGEADLLYRDGKKRARSRWFKHHVDGLPDFPAAATVDQVMHWFGTRVPISQNVIDGEREFSRQNPIPGIVNAVPKPKVRVMRFTDWGDDGNFPPGAQWLYARLGGVPQRVEPPEDVPEGIVVLRRDLGRERSEYWIDPAKDFVCVRQVQLRKVADQWKLARVDALEEWKQLPARQWHAARKRYEGYGVGDNLTDRPHVEVTEVDLRVLESGQIPAGTFDGEPLMKDADLESY